MDVGDCTTTPVSVTESCEFMTFRWRRRSSISVGFFVVMIRKVIESLESVRGVGMEGDAILTGADKIF